VNATDLVVGPWGARFMGRRFPCAVGRGGIGAKMREGDGVTPAGRHRIEAVLVRAGRCGAGGVVIGPRDGWSDDPADPDYNRPVKRPHGYGFEAWHEGHR
jgi:L,D-peptidoglycan transpeptidase YkuD (ErfK/YbiS/YcfS/YnhG family)